MDGMEQVGDPLLARLRPFGIMLPNHTRANPQDIGTVLFGSATGQNLSRQRVAESVSVSACYSRPFEHGAQRSGYNAH
jgi:hypothetical protein